MASEATILQVDGPHGIRDVRLSSPSRVLWPDLGINKLDLVKYIGDVGEAFVAANGDRPLALQRFPDRVEGEQFFSKNPPRGVPDYVRAVTVTYPSARASEARNRRSGGRSLGGSDEYHRLSPVAVPG